jgi:hypothetical protein
MSEGGFRQEELVERLVDQHVVVEQYQPCGVLEYRELVQVEPEQVEGVAVFLVLIPGMRADAEIS